MNANRPHVFRLTEDERALLDLWKACDREYSFFRFTKQLGVSFRWARAAMEKARDLDAIESDKRHGGYSSLMVARGRKRMMGTK